MKWKSRLQKERKEHQELAAEVLKRCKEADAWKSKYAALKHVQQLQQEHNKEIKWKYLYINAVEMNSALELKLSRSSMVTRRDQGPESKKSENDAPQVNTFLEVNHSTHTKHTKHTHTHTKHTHTKHTH